MVDSQTSRAVLMQERERWLRSVQVEGREELLFEFEMLLRGVERYFNLHNLPIDVDQRPVVTRDFSDELRDVREAIHQAIQIARQRIGGRSTIRYFSAASNESSTGVSIRKCVASKR